MPMRLVLFDPSHTRASMIQTAINRVFPEEKGQDGPTAHGLSSEQIDIRVPPSWKEDVPTFMNKLTHITIRLQNPESVAMSVKRLLLADSSPRNADAAMWRWRSIGDGERGSSAAGVGFENQAEDDRGARAQGRGDGARLDAG